MDGDNACFQAQIEQLHPEWVENSDIYSALDDLDFGDEYEIQEALKIISQIDND
jgi:hypothetical protein